MEGLRISRVDPSELDAVVRLFTDQVYPGDLAQAKQHFADHAEGQGDTLLAHVHDQLAGFLTIR
jgi:hypothetical protein